jgi:uncharacterized protein (DUF1501 family)
MIPQLDRRSWLKSLFFGSKGSPSLVVVFLRGGADGLNLVIPHFDKEYRKLRPTLALREWIALDDRFGWNVGFRPLEPHYREGRLAIVHAVGSDDSTRSHFEAQDLMERAGRPEEGAAGGWLGRHLRSKPGSRGAISSVSITPTLPESLRGAPSACALESIDEVTLQGADSAFTGALRVLFEADTTGAGKTALATLQLMERIAAMKDLARPETYPATHFGRALCEVARLLKADVGLEVACLDLGGWDTHFTQGPLLSSLVEELAGGLAAFAGDLGARLDQTVIVVMTEFGRRAYENASLGTDHGRASVMFVVGGPVRGGRVVAEWPGLGGNALEGPGDLTVTIDYRDVLSEIASKALGNPNIDQVFPGFKPRFRGLI